MSWEPQVGEKCEWQRDTDEWVVVNVLAVQNTEVCIDDGRLMQVVSRAALRPLAPAPEPPKRNTPEYLNTAYDRLDRAVQDVLKWSPDALRELVGAAMSMRDRARNALDTHATPPASSPGGDAMNTPRTCLTACGPNYWRRRIMSDLKTCPKGCHIWSEDIGQPPGWKVNRMRRGVPTPVHQGQTTYCFASHAELLSGGVVREMVPLEEEAVALDELRAEVERLRAALPTEEEILAMRYLKGYAHLCDTPEVETFRAYLARTEAQA